MTAAFYLGVDITPPQVEITQPVSGQALQDGVSLRAHASDDVEVSQVYFWIGGLSEPADTLSQDKGIPATLESGTPQSGVWTYSLDSALLPDGAYSLVAEAVDSQGNTAWSEKVLFTVRNLAVIELLPASKKNKAGRTIPVKFSLRVASDVDPAQPFVYNEELVVRIYRDDGSKAILQESRLGGGARDYRIDLDDELYITNFKTLNEASVYIVEVSRSSSGFVLGSFTFETE